MSDSDRGNSEIDVPQNSVNHQSSSGSGSNSGVDSASSSGTSTSTESIMSADQSDRTNRATSSSSSLDEDDDHYSPKYEPSETKGVAETHNGHNGHNGHSNGHSNGHTTDTTDLDDLLRACSGQQKQSHDSNDNDNGANNTQTAAADSLQRILQPLSQGNSSNGTTPSSTNGAYTSSSSTPTEPVSEAEIKSPLTPEEASQFSEYRRVESEYINSGNWDKFPIGSRMFIGNLPGDRIDTMELFKLFNQYGRLAQISIKRAYGFVQYFCPEDCERAMSVENGRYLRGFYLKLEVAQPQSKNRERRRSVSPTGYKSGDRYRSRSPGGSESDRNGDRGRSRHRDLLSRKKPHIIPEVQIVMESRVDRDFVHRIERPVKQNGMSVNYQWLQPRTSLKESLPDIVNQLIRERVFGLIIVERINQQANKVNLQVFHPAPGGGVRFDEYQMVDIPVAVELLGRVKREKMTNFHSQPIAPTHMGSPPPMPTNGYYGMPAIPGIGGLPNPAGMGLPGVGPMGIPMGIPTLSNDQVATLMALQTRLDTISLQKVALALQQQAAMQHQHQPQPQPQQGAFMPQFMSNTIPNLFPSPSPPPAKTRHHNGNGGNKNGFSKRNRNDRNGNNDRNNDRSADRGRSGPLPHGPVSNRPQPSAYVAQHTNRKPVSDSLAGRDEPSVSVPSSADPGQNVKNILDQLANLKG